MNVPLVATNDFVYPGCGTIVRFGDIYFLDDDTKVCMKCKFPVKEERRLKLINKSVKNENTKRTRRPVNEV
jgi:hypothetical protein